MTPGGALCSWTTGGGVINNSAEEKLLKIRQDLTKSGPKVILIPTFRGFFGILHKHFAHKQHLLGDGGSHLALGVPISP